MSVHPARCHQWHRRAQDRTDINFPSVTGDVLVLLDKHGGWGALPLQGAAGGQTQVKHGRLSASFQYQTHFSASIVSDYPEMHHCKANSWL